jgi:prephenate dehydratase
VSPRIAFLGPPGTFGEQAALLRNPAAELAPMSSHVAVVAAVAEGDVDEGIAAVENSLEGAVNETLDALLQHDTVFVCGELVLPIVHCLVAAPGTTLADVEVVLSHPQALAQCRGYLESRLPGARPEAALSTAAAVSQAVRQKRAAAIGTRRAAELAGAVVLAEAIQDLALNKTRFLVLARSDSRATGDDKTSIAFTVAHDRPGTLIGVLKELADRQINLTRIESRPSRQDLGIYIFLVDFQGHAAEPRVAAALVAVRAKAHFFRFLGSYPRFVEREPGD